MLCNHQMKKILNEMHCTGDETSAMHKNLIVKKFNLSGEDYYCLRKGFCLPDVKKVEFSGRELSDFEWEGNEMHLPMDNSMEELMKTALEAVGQLKRQMRNEFSDCSFDIFASLDLGDEEIEPSVNIWFYKVREGFHIIALEELDKYTQPIIICQVPETSPIS